jgi:hypothetical protein
VNDQSTAIGCSHVTRGGKSSAIKRAWANWQTTSTSNADACRQNAARPLRKAMFDLRELSTKTPDFHAPGLRGRSPSASSAFH